MSINIVNVSKKFGNLTVLSDFSLNLPDKGILCLFGPSGCGKTTLVNILSGLLKPDKGEIKGVKDNDVSFIFQEDRLVPWITVKENISLVARGKCKDLSVDEMIKSVGLKDFCNNKPDELSGGMCRKVAIARSLVNESEILIMDEPFKGLDEQSKISIMDLIYSKRKEYLNILITHSVDEAILMSDCVYVLGGRPLKLKNVFKIDLGYEDLMANKENFEKYKLKFSNIVGI